MVIDPEQVRTRMRERPTDELVEILARRARDEWQPEVFPIVEDVLRERGLDPAAVPPMPKQPAPDPSEELVPVASFLTPTEADLCRMALSEAGFETVMADENVSRLHIGLGIVAGGIKVLVHRRDLDAARSFLRDLPSATADWEDPELLDEPLLCRRCGRPEVETEKVLDRNAVIMAGFFLATPIPQYERRYKCRACGEAWAS